MITFRGRSEGAAGPWCFAGHSRGGGAATFSFICDNAGGCKEPALKGQAHTATEGSAGCLVAFCTDTDCPRLLIINRLLQLGHLYSTPRMLLLQVFAKCDPPHLKQRFRKSRRCSSNSCLQSGDGVTDVCVHPPKRWMLPDGKVDKTGRRNNIHHPGFCKFLGLGKNQGIMRISMAKRVSGHFVSWKLLTWTTR